MKLDKREEERNGERDRKMKPEGKTVRLCQKDRSKRGESERNWTFLQTKQQKHQVEKCLKQYSLEVPTLLAALFATFTINSGKCKIFESGVHSHVMTYIEMRSFNNHEQKKTWNSRECLDTFFAWQVAQFPKGSSVRRPITILFIKPLHSDVRC